MGSTVIDRSRAQEVKHSRPERVRRGIALRIATSRRLESLREHALNLGRLVLHLSRRRVGEGLDGGVEGR